MKLIDLAPGRPIVNEEDAKERAIANQIANSFKTEIAKQLKDGEFNGPLSAESPRNVRGTTKYSYTLDYSKKKLGIFGQLLDKIEVDIGVSSFNKPPKMERGWIAEMHLLWSFKSGGSNGTRIGAAEYTADGKLVGIKLNV